MKTPREARRRLFIAAVLALLPPHRPDAAGAEADPRAGRGDERPGEVLERAGQRGLDGRLAGDPRSGFSFIPEGGRAPIPLKAGAVVAFRPTAETPSAIPPPFRVRVGESASLSGTIRELGEDRVAIRVPWQPADVRIVRRAVQSIVQRSGEAKVFADSFERIEPSRWAARGRAELRSAAEGRGVRLAAPGSSLLHRLAEPLASGRLDVAFLDDAAIAPGRRWTADLTFRGPAGPASVRVVLGRDEESLAVECPDGPALAVQRLARVRGWRRLSIRFGPEQTEISVDGRELAHGKGPSGPLEAFAFRAEGPEEGKGAGEPAGLIGGVQLVRFAETPASLEIDPSQDEVRLVVGDQLYGSVRGGDGDRVEVVVDDKAVGVDWDGVSGLYFRRQAVASRPVEGLLARVDWLATPGEPQASRELDHADGAISAFDSAALTLETPYAGTLVIPRGRLTRIRLDDAAWRVVIDPAAHHLGDNVSTSPPLLDPPLPEGGLLVRSFDLPEAPAADRPAFVVLDVVQVVGEAAGSDFSPLVARGELRTYVEANGRRVDYINRYVATSNETTERIRIPLPPGLLKAGQNELRIVQTGIAKDPTWFDDLGILGVAIELDGPPTRTPSAPAPSPNAKP
ncbi:hypothetical protein OJF2_53520 [Aquisphaera giovannonii]|uniref:Uncharacterized protein n=1 Tax=Aquisphaera giovannonii TaxID=406548 RepID=A0A5B9W8Q5_9BACT|nr:hypothetical protein [Aquisphaera giovannonii]QEH36767.1 hypothetical protein OJF2_53520 [Aquisphaera giovannonii]